MKKPSFKLVLIAATLLIGLFAIKGLFLSQEKVDFNTAVRPILNRHCLKCHGGVKAQSGLSFLFEEEAFAPAESGLPAILPGDARHSELIKRIKHHDPELRMPPAGDPLSQAEIQTLSLWIDQGAKWAKHWAYIPPQQHQVPTPKAPSYFPLQNEIDHFILAKLSENKLDPSPVTDKVTLLKRLSLDLIGLPPTPAELEAFLEDDSELAIEKVVDRLLASPHFGERWAAMWMDLARYGDSQGYQKDPYRSIWRYRDWLIDAFNQNLPFDQFTIQQIAGDLLPEPSESQLLATAFHRNTMTNDEGGTDDEEFRVAAVMDRISTTWEVWQGTTMACVQCHSHPYDPFEHKDFYTTMAFFNNTADADTYNDAPNFPTFSKPNKKQIQHWASQMTNMEHGEEITDSRVLNNIRRMALFPNWKPGFCDSWDLLQLDGKNQARRLGNGAWLAFEAVDLSDIKGLQILYADLENPGKVAIRLDSLNGPVWGETTLRKAATGKASLSLSPTAQGKRDIYIQFTSLDGPFSRRLVIQDIQFQLGAKEKVIANQEVADSLAALTMVMTPIMKDLPPNLQRKTHVFERGNWLVHGEEVKPDVPHSLFPLPTKTAYNRLDFAQWLVSPDNPLTARVIVNRFWSQLMGRGIVETLEDFGSQGTPPSHPELLDWLAIHFQQDLKWDIKALLRQMVLSSSYQQSSNTSAEAMQKDPNNRWWSRAYRRRLTAEQVRDQTLAVCGLLSEKMYGPSVMPPQPEGVWQVIRGVMRWKESEGEDRYRRALYTFWRKSSPYPSFMTFDSPSREYCVSRRIPTNTPLQALVTMNDTVYVEAARALARQMQDVESQNLEEKLSVGYKKALFKTPTDGIMAVLAAQYTDNLAFYEANPEEAQLMAQVATEKAPELAALTVVGNVILNLDEFVVRE
ncbi:MAG: DUF1553 domain-containing protein [Saprospiraceae bacterium]